MQKQAVKDLQYLAVRALLDSDIRLGLQTDPIETAEKNGVILSPEQLEHLSSIDWNNIEKLAERIQEINPKPAAWGGRGW